MIHHSDHTCALESLLTLANTSVNSHRVRYQWWLVMVQSAWTGHEIPGNRINTSTIISMMLTRYYPLTGQDLQHIFLLQMHVHFE